MVDPSLGTKIPTQSAAPPSDPPAEKPGAGDTRHLHVLPRRVPKLPIPLTGFVGREGAITELARLLEATRLLTLTGPGGSGKSRLAIEVGRRSAESFPEGVEWVELASLTDPELVPQALATALNIRQQPGSSFLETLGRQLQSRRLLLVLDNCEHLVAACAEVVAALLQSCPELRILATSREALGLAGEIAWPVPPLSLPQSGSGANDHGRGEAVELFVDRARAVLPSFELNQRNAPVVARICERLDGIPLAIELAAARSKLLSPAQIASRLDDCFRLLTVGNRASVARQHTLRATMDWSYDLLTEQERSLFARLGVFEGGFTLEAAEAVCAGGDIAPDEVLDLLTHLVDKSLVAVGEQAGEARCRLLETVRQYAIERLEEGEEEGEGETTRRQHASHFLALAEAAEPELVGARQGAAMDELEVEHDNLRGALRWLLARGEVVLAARLGGALWRFWHTRGYLSEGRQWLEQALTTASNSGASAAGAEWQAAQAKALQGAGVLAWGQGDYDQSTVSFEAALRLAEQLQDGDRIAALYNNLGVVALHQADYARAIELFEASLVLRRDQGHEQGIATLLNNLGAAAGKQGDLNAARRYYEESLALHRAIGNTQGAAICLSNLGAVAYEQGDDAQAHAFFEEGLGLRRLLADRTGVADSFGKLGKVALRRGARAKAQGYYEASLELLRELGDRERIAGGLTGIAALALAEEQPVRAVRFLGAADTVREAIGAPLTAEERADQERYISAAHEVLGAETFAAVWAEGRAMPLDQVLDLAAEALRSPTHAAGLPDRDARSPSTAAEPSAEVARAAVASPPHPTAEAPRPAPEVRILALGPLEVWRREGPVAPAEWGSAKPRELLFYLLCHPAGRTKEQIGLALWPEASPNQLRNSFHVALHHLRRALGRAEWIVFENDRYRFDRSLPYEFDVETFETLLASAERLRQDPETPRSEAIHSLESAVSCYRGDFLEDTLFGDWHLERQDELRRRRSDALLLLAELLFAECRFDDAAGVYRQALAHDRLLQRAHHGLMRSLAHQGERERALRHYQVVEALLRDELGTSPAAETTALYTRIREGQEV